MTGAHKIWSFNHKRRVSIFFLSLLSLSIIFLVDMKNHSEPTTMAHNIYKTYYVKKKTSFDFLMIKNDTKQQQEHGSTNNMACILWWPHGMCACIYLFRLYIWWCTDIWISLLVLWHTDNSKKKREKNGNISFNLIRSIDLLQDKYEKRGTNKHCQRS